MTSQGLYVEMLHITSRLMAVATEAEYMAIVKAHSPESDLRALSQLRFSGCARWLATQYLADDIHAELLYGMPDAEAGSNWRQFVGKAYEKACFLFADAVKKVGYLRAEDVAPLVKKVVARFPEAHQPTLSILVMGMLVAFHYDREADLVEKFGKERKIDPFWTAPGDEAQEGGSDGG